MESQEKPSPGQWAPWIDDPDDPSEGVMTPEQARAFAEKVKARMQREGLLPESPKPAP
jgi:hypothetical protein